MSKTPYELRADLLKMAKEYLDQQWHANVDFAKESFFRSVEAGKTSIDQWKEFAPQNYTIEELTKKAQELYAFVEKK